MEKVKDLREHSTDTLDYILQAYLFVRDEISHTWDVKVTVISFMHSIPFTSANWIDGFVWMQEEIRKMYMRNSVSSKKD